MTWTLANLVTQIIAGIIGGHAAAGATHEHSFGAAGHTVTGLLGGFLSGYFLQALPMTLVTADGTSQDLTPPETIMMQALAGLAAGAIVTMLVGFIKHSIDRHRASSG